ncbi:dipeptide epimerase [Hyphococcus lacteus]|uniref:Dipeptide epimerase n=1 Tax=Hyphococcus lacteus TaxID=3143536 RepID=A0ABV3Z6V6_9PROT
MIDPLSRIASIDLPTVEKATVRIEPWRLKTPFTIARGVEYEISLVVVELSGKGATGYGESCPVAHYGETPKSVAAQVETFLERLRSGQSWASIHDQLPAGAARNAVDCAVWDFAAKWVEKPIFDLIDVAAPQPVETVFTISFAEPDVMAKQAASAKNFRKLKLKLGGEGDLERVQAVRKVAPDKVLIADVNEYWDDALFSSLQGAIAAAGISMLEQPLPANDDGLLESAEHLTLIGADESCHVSNDLDQVARRYDVVNIKLDKTGGFTEALRLLDGALSRGLQPMVGCMLGTSLAVAPAFYIAQKCSFVDLDAPLLIGKDRDPAMEYNNGWVSPSASSLIWG